ncbi:hypothetical protein M8J76_004926 [Diaphorina citri]|nr:hypothetical protein M8J76_004926 [Diaphorina citri]
MVVLTEGKEVQNCLQSNDQILGHYPSKDISDTLTMPKLIQVKSLYTITLKQVNSILCELAQNDQCSPDTVTWIKSHLHGNIREQLLAQFNQWHLPYNFNYMKCVIDCSLKSIVLNECLSNRAMTGLNYIEFMKYLHEQNICNLCNFSLHFKKYLLETAKLKEGNYYLCLSLNNGMARNLTTVVLPYVADNSVLKCLGQHCTQLVYLDIANSWNIDEDGIFNLLFKNPEDLNLPVDDISSEMDPPSECLLDELTVPDEELNPVCFTIQEIRIQDTNTSPTNLFIILLTVKNLKSLGGYLYFRSVGDAIVTLKSNNPSLKLNLTHLWDAHLPPLKLDTLAQVLPHLTTLSTRVSNLPFKRAATSPNKCGAVFFNIPSRHFQPYNFNLLWIHQHCPLLQDLTACVMVPEEARSLLPQMSALRSAALTLNSEHTLLAVFQMLPCALQLTIKIRLSYNMYENGITYAGTVQDLCALDLPCYNSLQDLRLHFVSETVPEPGFGVSEAIKLLELFKNLRTFGNLDTWGSAMNLATLHDHVKAKRWDVALKRGFDICEESNVFYR